MVSNKKELYFNCLDIVNKQIERYQKEMDLIKESMEANDVKTDYDEDNKGELLSDFEKNARRLSNAREMKESLSRIDPELYSEKISFGSVIETSGNYYFISVPIGEISMEDGSSVYAISTEAPIYQEMEGKKQGDTFKFNGNEVKITAVG
ncbi:MULTISPECIES: transcription elongation factor [Salegentibacter]|uniref:Transcription elongation factor n=1 Tax=Salegentibacter maritimus TaxID=2794347 RepID=A0ABS0TCP8_9FLAO|nr:MULTISPECIES: transcription elongation factor [Salegentibacter]MBE7638797.1 transcription elongation factor [Salegentibacter sp. BLCTC]MBI6115140.1 transcription elongation factor [Salegentibacter maritimus]MBI6118814.1 transcription elongation factor [Salegentibacter maritimus]